MRNATLLTILVALAALPACRNTEAPANSESLKAAVAAEKAAPAAAANDAAAPTDLKGKVLERIDASSYSYLRLDTGKGETWAAVPQTDVAKGAEVVVAKPMRMTNFESKTLERTFEVIWFGALKGQNAGAVAAAASAKEQAHGGMKATHAGASAAPAEVKDVKVEKAQGENARTVAEIHAQRAKLAGQEILVRGTVVKVNAGIMDRNWIHLRDGSGDAAAGTNDLTVTSGQAVPKVGDVITIGGKVAVDRDFGAGYKYPVLVEDASIRN